MSAVGAKRTSLAHHTNQNPGGAPRETYCERNPFAK